MIQKLVSSVFLFVLLVAQPFTGQAQGVTVIREEESFHAPGKAIASQVFSGETSDTACSYFELIETAKSTAISLGANVVRVDKHISRSRSHPCDEVSISFYQVDDLRLYEKRFNWTEDRKLVWDDFKGPVPSGASPKTAAETSCGIAIETNTVRGASPIRVYIFNNFLTATSWVRPQYRNDADILRHEQGHFDLCELYTRKMRERFSKAALTFENMRSVIAKIYNETMGDYAARQQAYEAETNHGLIPDAQQRWTEQIARELQETRDWKST